jgi:microcystin-dependent protein
MSNYYYYYYYHYYYSIIILIIFIIIVIAIICLIRFSYTFQNTLGGVSDTGFVPVGAVLYFSRVTPPAGFLKANGNVVPNGVGTVQGVTADFSALYAILGSTYGTVGTLPDLRGQFLRGFVDGSTVDAGRVFGSAQLDSFKSHTHMVTPSGQDNNAALNGVSNRGWAFNGGFSSVTTLLPTDAVGGAETRPLNVALLVCIKY